MYIKTHPQNIIMNEIATYLGPKGYTILKEYLDIDDINLIRKELTVKPFVPKVRQLLRPHLQYIERVRERCIFQNFMDWKTMENQKPALPPMASI